MLPAKGYVPTCRSNTGFPEGLSIGFWEEVILGFCDGCLLKLLEGCESSQKESHSGSQKQKDVHSSSFNNSQLGSQQVCHSVSLKEVYLNPWTDVN
jgi:hypothetical protein